MLDADNAAFVNGIVTVVRWIVYGALACAILWLVFWVAYWLLAMLWKGSRWLWEAILWPVLDSVTFGALAWLVHRCSDEYAQESARKKLRNLGY